MMLQSGKPVLCEKPKSTDSREVQQMISLAKEKNLFFMEAIWSRFFPVYEKVREILRSGELGEVRIVTASLGINFDGVPRLRNRSLAVGSLIEAGIYPIQFAAMVFGEEKPQGGTATGHLTDTGVDESATVGPEVQQQQNGSPDLQRVYNAVPRGLYLRNNGLA
ncbi:trans-1,2-dihydrobenzene-1,2-diol dehydrogenase-like [Branchiostoma floridae]|uniref:Trans-1,2-dihydrobenzene-1,2-diol dehydrogenase n=1 Tax=Branchiostoma floridae TaxID=7739 RepID=A0A9J7LKF6_BRAFL|nr:trans-1,2-dihydrobenzene-1,2-diol dehydrogenase-like [Branchiostoma floridae]